MTASINASSSIHSTWPAARSNASASARCAGVTFGDATPTLIPRPIAAGVFGIARTTAPSDGRRKLLELTPEGRDALDLFASAFPPGSITGAPKVQAMMEIARHERPRGPYCGSMFWAGDDGAFDSSVLIRTLAFEEDAGGWSFEARAGAGIVADSDPLTEAQETEAKIAALKRALTGTGP